MTAEVHSLCPLDKHYGPSQQIASELGSISSVVGHRNFSCQLSRDIAPDMKSIALLYYRNQCGDWDTRYAHLEGT